MKSNKIKIYGWNDIQTVYEQFNKNPHSVVYSFDNGLTWQSPEMDTGKWGSECQTSVYWNMKFAFLEMKTLHQKKKQKERVWNDSLKD